MDCGPYHPKPITKAGRVAVKGWIRSHFDAVLDFDAAARDPARPDRLAPAGYRALAAAIPLALFA